MSSTTVHFGTPDGQFSPKHTVFIGPKALLGSESVKAGLKDALSDVVRATAKTVEDGREKAAKTWDGERSFTFAELETKTSRNLGTVRSDLVHNLVQKHVPSKDDGRPKDISLSTIADDIASSATQRLAFERRPDLCHCEVHILHSHNISTHTNTFCISAISRAFPKFSRKSSSKNLSPRTVAVTLLTPSSGALSPEAYAELNVLCGAVRHAAHLVDSPTAELDTSALVREVDAVAARHSGSTKKTVISGDALAEAGLNAIWGVGKAARAPPALAVLEYTPEGMKVDESTPRLALVGKGIVYDTGGLSLKGTAGMCDMKTDCGGAVALLAAFDALVRLKTPFPVVYVGCIAENAIGSGSQRNDDIVVALSGKSIEINNTGECLLDLLGRRLLN